MPKNKIIIFILISTLLLFGPKAFGYDHAIVHPGLTQAAISVFEESADNLSVKEKKWIIQGSMEEDAHPRYLNHFFNPKTGLGLDDKGLPGLPTTVWAMNQSNFTSIGGDYSENAILNNYENNNFERAFQGIGHMLHLIQDMAVPAHVRNDAHDPTDPEPYEKWSKEFGNIENQPRGIISTFSLKDSLVNLSSYTHDNFFSKDTISIIDLNKYKIEGQTINNKKIIYLINSVDDYEYKVAFKENPDSISSKFEVGQNAEVNLDYWNMLYPKAVGYSAGVIEYYIKKFEQIDKNKKEVQKISAWKEFKSQVAYSIGDYISASLVSRKGEEDLSPVQLNAIAVALEVLEGTRNAADKSVEVGNKTIVLVNESSKKIKRTAQNAVDIIKDKIQGAVDGPSAPGKVLGVKEVKADELGSTTIEVMPLGKPKTAFFPVLEQESQPSGTIILEDNFSPDTEIAEKPAIISSSSAAYFRFSSERGESYEINLDDSGWTSSGFEQNLSGLMDGAHSLAVRAVDAKGAADPIPAVYDWTVDTRAPFVSFISSPGQFSNTSSTIIRYEADETSTFSCGLDSADPAPCSASTSLPDLSEGAHQFLVFASDGAGNTGSASVNWLIDLTAPAASIGDLAPEQQAKAFTLDFSGIDQGPAPSGISSYEVEYMIGTSTWENLFIGPATSTIFDKNVSDGDYIHFRIRATDQAGNSADWSETYQTKVNTKIASHLLISEIAVRGPAGGYDEFVELYNPTSNEINVLGYKLESKTNAMNWWTNRTGSGLPDKVIKPGGYFLIAAKEYSLASIPDYYHTANWGLPDSNGTWRIVDADGNELDKAGYGFAADYEGSSASADFSQGGSIERKARLDSSVASMDNGHEWQGNGVDTGNNGADFLFRAVPEPQNSYSPSEPSLEEPDIPSTIGDLKRTSSSDTSISISWSAPANANLSSGALYEIKYAEKNGDCSLINNWGTASLAAVLFAPSAYEGYEERLEIGGLLPNAGYCLAIRTFNGQYWSSVSNILGATTRCVSPTPAFTGNLSVRRGLAAGSATGTEENILILDFFGSTDQGFQPFGHPEDSCVAASDIGFGDSDPGSRLIIEAEYDTDSGLFTGRFRFCTDNGFNANMIENDQCRDGNVWGGSRWGSSASLAGKPEIMIYNSSQYTSWLNASE